MPRLCIVAALTLVVAGCGPPEDTPAECTPMVVDDPYPLYDAVLADGYGFSAEGPRLVVREHTLYEFGIVGPEEPDELEDAAVEDLWRRKEAAYVLDATGFSVGDPVVIVPTIETPGGYWDRETRISMMSEYGAAYVHLLSPVGVGCEQAVVEVLQFCGDFCGGGEAFGLTPDDDGGWVVSVRGYELKF